MRRQQTIEIDYDDDGIKLLSCDKQKKTLASYAWSDILQFLQAPPQKGQDVFMFRVDKKVALQRGFASNQGFAANLHGGRQDHIVAIGCHDASAFDKCFKKHGAATKALPTCITCNQPFDDMGVGLQRCPICTHRTSTLGTADGQMKLSVCKNSLLCMTCICKLLLRGHQIEGPIK